MIVTQVRGELKSENIFEFFRRHRSYSCTFPSNDSRSEARRFVARPSRTQGETPTLPLLPGDPPFDLNPPSGGHPRTNSRSKNLFVTISLEVSLLKNKSATGYVDVRLLDVAVPTGATCSARQPSELVQPPCAGLTNFMTPSTSRNNVGSALMRYPALCIVFERGAG